MDLLFLLFSSFFFSFFFVACCLPFHRYWHMAEDGCYIVTFSSMEHPDCKVDPAFIRGECGTSTACRMKGIGRCMSPLPFFLFGLIWFLYSLYSNRKDQSHESQNWGSVMPYLIFLFFYLFCFALLIFFFFFCNVFACCMRFALNTDLRWCYLLFFSSFLVLFWFTLIWLTFFAQLNWSVLHFTSLNLTWLHWT